MGVWKRGKVGWEPNWNKEAQIWKELPVLGKCGCKSTCESMRCSCLRNSLPCTLQCTNCRGRCKNQSVLSAVEKPILYGDLASPPVRFAMMTASYLGIELKFHKIDLFCGEHRTESYKKINPLQKVPALQVGKEIIRDSHAIALHLCKISGNNELYPEDDITQAKVNEMLFFNASALFPLDSAIYTAYFAGKWPADEEQVKRWSSLLDYLEMSLLQNQWLVSDKVMVCDFCCAATVSSLRLLLPSLERHKRVDEWIKKLQLLPCYKINIEGLNRLKHFIAIVN